jgi:site-specific recombinase XerD
LRHGHVDVKRLKGSMHTVQRYQHHPDPELNEEAMLNEIVPELKDGENLISMTRSGLLKMFKRAALRAGINPLKAHPHALKHSCAMTVIGSGIENARQRLGHKSLSSTGAYLRVTDDKASDAINAFLGV